MRIFKSKWFQRFAAREGIEDSLLMDAVLRAVNGQVDADLGGEVLKQRIARPGQGKSKGYRTIIFFRRGHRAFFQYGFSKSERSNIDAAEQREFKEAAKFVLGLDDIDLALLTARGDFVEVKTDEQEIPQ